MKPADYVENVQMTTGRWQCILEVEKGEDDDFQRTGRTQRHHGAECDGNWGAYDSE